MTPRLVAALALLVALTACSGSPAGDSNPPNTQTNTVPTPKASS